MARAEIVNQIANAQALIDDGENNEALPILLEIKDKIIDLKFWPVLDNILPIIINMLEKKKEYQSLCLYYLIRNSLYLQSQDYETRFAELSDFLNRIPETQLTVSKECANIIPLVCSLHYLPDHITTGTKPHLICDILSNFAKAIHINDISIEFMSSNSNIHSISLGDFTFLSQKCIRRIVDYDVDPTITSDKVTSVTCMIGNGIFRIEKDFGAEIHITSPISNENERYENAPFSYEYQLFDHNFKVIEKPTIEQGEFITAELTLTNISDHSSSILDVTSVNTELQCFDIPIDLFPGEQYCFHSTIKDNEDIKSAFFTVSYTTEISDNPHIFEFSIDNIQKFDRLLIAKFEAPQTVVKNQPFEGTLTLEVDQNEPYTQIFIEIIASPRFLVNGFSRKSLFLFAGQKKEIKIGFVALEAGQTILPAIYVHNIAIKENNPKVFLSPIVVTF
ncbi:hypothetical protein TRFO_15486 [Tritrichomonas foetus]|uniref:Trafficking protein particle complex subunit 11 C-terminal domain-containing protein n=1 Tax=Tritrichomonas foetus TaxID=1144522 RepID=A0A1J4KXB5_9EUKA|nr:hypothetical protein TRFO_15486 [Tritrichomonas foetus]|eukprot:OHT14197.1 hypothetical protein TRFO_15486 [Tritrichomonas foetus]